ncbi:sodium channel protein Nach [Drosophila busckii]|uniref:sodium channel protein Nach n=1 Tax=Drosophila busckii TaxID=30019 RepID=UPI00083ED92B|nr:sodium channel protein Nach [Drosophila busckii]
MYRQEFNLRAVSIVYESISPFESIKFPTVSVCEITFTHELNEDLEQLVKSLGTGVLDAYNFELEQMLTKMMYPYQYTDGKLTSTCDAFDKCDKCAKCLPDGYRQLVEQYTSNCTEIFMQCKLSDREFDCCQHFLPLYTPFGKCFLLNSLQNNQPNSPHWLPALLDPSYQRAVMHLSTNRSVHVGLQNEEDLPHKWLPGVGALVPNGQALYLRFNSELMANDADMKEVSVESRACYMPEELQSQSVYNAYSFSSCMSDCTRAYQLELCNCTPYFMNPIDETKTLDCDLAGLFCLESYGMLHPTMLKVQRFESLATPCECLPSCSEGDIISVYQEVKSQGVESFTNLTLVMPNWPAGQYRRQVLRTTMDLVVSMGGILGLFLGASILSLIEFIYYFSIRAFNSYLTRKRNEKKAKE